MPSILCVMQYGPSLVPPRVVAYPLSLRVYPLSPSSRGPFCRPVACTHWSRLGAFDSFVAPLRAVIDLTFMLTRRLYPLAQSSICPLCWPFACTHSRGLVAFHSLLSPPRAVVPRFSRLLYPLSEPSIFPLCCHTNVRASRCIIWSLEY